MTDKSSLAAGTLGGASVRTQQSAARGLWSSRWVFFLAATGSAGRPLFWFALLMAGFMVWTHRSNLARMRAGTENRMVRGLRGLRGPGR